MYMIDYVKMTDQNQKYDRGSIFIHFVFILVFLVHVTSAIILFYQTRPPNDIWYFLRSIWDILLRYSCSILFRKMSSKFVNRLGSKKTVGKWVPESKFFKCIFSIYKWCWLWKKVLVKGFRKILFSFPVYIYDLV